MCRKEARTPFLGSAVLLEVCATLAAASTLLEPFRHTLADFFLADQFTAVRLAKTSLDFVKYVKPIQGILDASIVGEVLNCLQYPLLRPHDNSPISLRILDGRVRWWRGSGLVGIELGRASCRREGYQPRPFGCEVGSQFPHDYVSRGPPIMPDGRVSQVRFEALAFRR